MAGAIALGIGSCKSDKYEEPISSFRVVKTEFASTAKGGEGLIILSEGGFEVSTMDSWVKATKSGEKEVKLLIEPNPQGEGRATNVLIKKGSDAIEVPITQLGIVDYIPPVDNQSFKRQGGTFEVDLTQLTNEPKITVEPDASQWLSYNIEEGKLKVVVTANENNRPARQARIQIEAGLALKEIVVSQEEGLDTSKVLYTNEVAGVYQLTYSTNVGDANRQSVDIQIVPTDTPNRFVVRGLAFPFYADLEPENGILKFLRGEAAERVADLRPEDENGRYAIYPFDGKNVLNEGGDFIGTWDKVDKTTAKFTFAPGNSAFPIFAFTYRDPKVFQFVDYISRPFRLAGIVIQRKGDLPA